MKLSDIKGERSLDIIADAMELVEKLNGDERFGEMVAALKECKGDQKAGTAALCKHLPPLLRDKTIKKAVVKFLASASGVTYKEYAENGAVLQDLMELLLSDSEAVGFLAGSLGGLA